MHGIKLKGVIALGNWSTVLNKIIILIGILYAAAFYVSSVSLDAQKKLNLDMREAKLAACEERSVFSRQGCQCRAFSDYRAASVRATHYVIPFSYAPRKPDYSQCSR